MNRQSAGKRESFIVFIIIALQLTMILLSAGNKVGFHIDENYSHILSNSYDADNIINADWMWGSWINGADFNEFVTVQEGEAFSYATVYYNNSTDCHPPLYYWILHTVCSFAPGSFNMWYGIGINLFFFVIAELFLYLLSRELLRSEKAVYIPLLLYGFSLLALDTCIYIRMYMLLTTLSVIFVYLQIRLIKYGFSAKRVLLSALVIYLGAMTQYYFLVLAFFGVLIQTILFFSKKEFKKGFLHGGAALAAVILMELSYPYAIEQATGSSTNNVGNEVAKDLFNFGLWGKMILRQHRITGL